MPKLYTSAALEKLWVAMASGASHRGLLADTDEVTAVLYIMRERLKSVTFTCQCLSTTKLGDFKSLRTQQAKTQRTG